ncbi:MAG: hypothetical protein HY584_05880 [Candidatus Omnitrophica bacterium]|nr:hypothetical protein [Candidatus Omnitrophota bacterium]
MSILYVIARSPIWDDAACPSAGRALGLAVPYGRYGEAISDLPAGKPGIASLRPVS